ncbi:MAG TPA: peptidoglycan editing factor PgeF [Steroidobacteraceae bacterium]|nr:peptidoglycan editing factor PgeF [Steroidobacteraceae bacterium]
MTISKPDFIVPDWPSPAGIRAAFTLRAGGVSLPPFDTFNIGAHVGDDPNAIAGNRARLREHLALPAEPLWLQQVHGQRVVDLDRQTSRDSFGPADAAVTRSSGRVCAIQVADCMPVLFAAKDGSVVGAAHAGWRGLAAGVLESTVLAMKVPAGELIAWMGPAIGPAHFEVGEEVRTAFLAADSGASAAFAANERGRWQCDLYALAGRRLAALGVSAVHGGGWCTYADAGRFFSYRRDGRCGRMAALIWRSS